MIKNFKKGRLFNLNQNLSSGLASTVVMAQGGVYPLPPSVA